MKTDCNCPKDEFGVQWHPSDCPKVAWMKELQQELIPELIEMKRARDCAEVESRNFWIG